MKFLETKAKGVDPEKLARFNTIEKEMELQGSREEKRLNLNLMEPRVQNRFLPKSFKNRLDEQESNVEVGKQGKDDDSLTPIPFMPNDKIFNDAENCESHSEEEFKPNSNRHVVKDSEEEQKVDNGEFSSQPKYNASFHF